MFVARTGIRTRGFREGQSGLTALLAPKKKKKEDQTEFICWIPCMLWPCLGGLLGLMILLGGTSMCATGYYARYFSSSKTDNGTHIITNIDTSKHFHMHNLTFIGPVIMGCGCFIMVIACVVICEQRDKDVKTKIEEAKKKRMERGNRKSIFYKTVVEKLKISKVMQDLKKSSNSVISLQDQQNIKDDTNHVTNDEKSKTQLQLLTKTTYKISNETKQLTEKTSVNIHQSNEIVPESRHPQHCNQFLVASQRVAYRRLCFKNTKNRKLKEKSSSLSSITAEFNIQNSVQQNTPGNVFTKRLTRCNSDLSNLSSKGSESINLIHYPEKWLPFNKKITVVTADTPQILTNSEKDLKVEKYEPGSTVSRNDNESHLSADKLSVSYEVPEVFHHRKYSHKSDTYVQKLFYKNTTLSCSSGIIQDRTLCHNMLTSSENKKALKTSSDSDVSCIILVNDSNTDEKLENLETCNSSTGNSISQRTLGLQESGSQLSQKVIALTENVARSNAFAMDSHLKDKHSKVSAKY